MDKKHGFLEYLTHEAAFPADVIPSRSVVEILEDQRVLIENHLGVKGYSTECVIVQLRIGCLHISGENLQILRMSKEQLVIAGRIRAVSIRRRGSA